MRAATLCVVFPSLIAVALASAQTGPPAPEPALLQVTRLELDLRVDYDRRALSGIATVHVRNRSDRPVAAIPFLLNRLMSVSSVRTAGGDTLPFAQRVVIFQDDSSRQVQAVVVTPPRPIPPGDSLQLALRYDGILVGYTETGSLYIQDRVDREFTIIREDAYAFPVLGVPSWRSNRALPREPFVFAARVAVPAGLVVAMGGEPETRTARDSSILWAYHSTTPVPFLNITIAPYRVIEHPGARIFYFPADSDGARMVAQAITAAMDRFTRWFGPLGRAAQLVVMEIPEGFGSQASLTAGILQTADAFHDRAALPQVYHELSHLWNPPDLDAGRPSPRWNEGLASFLQWRMAAELDGWNDWDARVARTVESVKRRCGAPSPCDSVPFTDFGTAGLTDRSYGVGLLMFYSLYQVLGPETFDRAYGAFFQAHRGTGATPDELAAAFHRASRKSDPIFADWFVTARWYHRITAGVSVGQMVDGYR